MSSSATPFQQYLEALLEGDVRGMERQVTVLLDAGTPLVTILRDYVRAGMYEVGRLWACGEASVAVEHLAASATSLLLSQFRFHPEHAPASGRRAIIACVPDERHDIGALMVANLCDIAGWKVMLLGADTPAADLLSLVAQHEPDMLGLSATLPASRPQLEATVDRAGARFPMLEILVGGQALDDASDEPRYRKDLLARFPRLRYLHTLEELQTYLRPRDVPHPVG